MAPVRAWTRAISHPGAGAQLGIQVGQRLVQQQHLRLAHQRPPRCHPLALATEQLRRLALQQRFQLQHGCRLAHALPAFGGRHAAQTQGEGRIVGHAHVRVQRVTLEHHGDVAVLARSGVHLPAADPQGAPGDVLQPVDRAQQGACAASRRSRQHQALAIDNLEIGLIHTDVATGKTLLTASSVTVATVAVSTRDRPLGKSSMAG